MLLNAVFQKSVFGIAVDETHCVKKWLVAEVLCCCACFL